jgi:methylated-DNA-[protein]-cysteine S-methyltransferase
MHDPELFDGVYEAPIGWLGIRLQGEKISELDWIERPRRPLRQRHPHTATRQVIRCLDSYFTTASFPKLPLLASAGTPFQQRVWRALLRIPCGRVKTYGQLAAELKTGSRAIGQACRSNPIAILIPCHRVVAAGDMGGYMGNTGHLHIKRWLLEHEGVY